MEELKVQFEHKHTEELLNEFIQHQPGRLVHLAGENEAQQAALKLSSETARV